MIRVKTPTPTPPIPISNDIGSLLKINPIKLKMSSRNLKIRYRKNKIAKKTTTRAHLRSIPKKIMVSILNARRAVIDPAIIKLKSEPHGIFFKGFKNKESPTIIKAPAARLLDEEPRVITPHIKAVIPQQNVKNWKKISSAFSLVFS